MKKIASVLLTLILVSIGIPRVFASEGEYPLSLNQVRIRDPFVLVYEGKYYMYGTGLKWDGYGCVISEDLEHWSEPQWVFHAPEGFDGIGDWWAPECHYYNGGFYLFATYRSAASGKRGTAVFRSDSPLGPFSLLSDGHITPKYRDCIDGTLYVDENGQPWIVYVGEWTSNDDGVGEMYAAKLSQDLSACVGEPILLFRATDGQWTHGNITDGPFVYKTTTGQVLMLWSNHSGSGYAVGLAYAVNQNMAGKWVQDLLPFYQKDSSHMYDGGHAMLFTDLDGQLRMALHSPNTAEENVFEHAVFIPVEDVGFTLIRNDGAACSVKGIKAFTKMLQSFYSLYQSLFAPFRRFVSILRGNCE